jgi:hypothetical protein
MIKLPRVPRVGLRPALLSLGLVVLAASAWRMPGTGAPPRVPGPAPVLPPREASREEVERTCGGCHPTPPPEIFPDFLWPHEVERGFTFLERGQVPADTPSFGSVVAYYRSRAPKELPALGRTDPPTECPAQFRRTGYRASRGPQSPAVANVRFVHLSDERRLDVVACDMINGEVLLLRPYQPAAGLRVVTRAVPNPAHAEVADLDGDGVKDLLVANLGSPIPTDERLGSVVWLRGRADGSFEPVTLADKLGRVADVQAADFDGDGDLDLIAAVFGWQETGGVLLLENRTTDPERPAFVPTTVDPRHGAIHVPVADLDGDGRPDFVALISQEHETVVAFLNAGGRRFVPRVIYAAPHPGFGSSGIQLVDLDRDGDLDVLMTNGDSMDSELLRPYHGVQWLENRGTYPFLCHRLTPLYGAQRAVAADIDGDGDLDVVAVSFLPGAYYQGLRREMGLDAVIVLEQATPGRFVRHSLEAVTCDHATCDLGDFDADGKVDLVVGNAFVPYGYSSTGDHSDADGVILRRNLGPPRGRPTRTPPPPLGVESHAGP